MGTSDFIRALGESSIYSSQINRLLDDLIYKKTVITEETWRGDESLQIDRIEPADILEYKFNHFVSSITNSVGKTDNR